jgi:hypothetical protein
MVSAKEVAQIAIYGGPLEKKVWKIYLQMHIYYS